MRGAPARKPRGFGLPVSAGRFVFFLLQAQTLVNCTTRDSPHGEDLASTTLEADPRLDAEAQRRGREDTRAEGEGNADAEWAGRAGGDAGDLAEEAAAGDGGADRAADADDFERFGTRGDDGLEEYARDAGGPIRVAFYEAQGVGEEGLREALEALEGAGGFDAAMVSPSEVRGGELEGRDVVVFSGGIGSVQGRLLEEKGRRIVREFVGAGGGYVGICAGAYLAMQGPREYHHLELVAARSWSEDAWRRGIAMLDVGPVGGGETLELFYANGPVFRRDPAEGLAPFVPLLEYREDQYCASCGTSAGELPGTPAALAAEYGCGRIVLFSPNPVLARGEAEAHPELFVAAVRWVAARGPVDADLSFDDVFR
ncbi:MAG: hypothetical protein HY905_19630 [Deltaproteobacteria bacterium]|nr:hypothetical protein [Deltaproteobacteria bacterium]